MKAIWSYILFLAIGLPTVGSAQGFSLPDGQSVEKIKFELVNNLIIVPIEVNGTELSFLLDSGVSKPILFNLSDSDSVEIKDVSEISIRGLGQGEPMKALSSKGNTFRMGTIENPDQLLYVVLDPSLNFSPSLGRPVHGIIGYDLFRDFIVDIHYSSKKIMFHDPDTYVYRAKRKSRTLPLSIINKKAYVDGSVHLAEQGNVPVRLLLDTGSSDAIWLFQSDSVGIPDRNYEDFLGKGLSGDIMGRRTRVNGFAIGGFHLKEAKAAFPDRASFNAIKNLGNRNGSIGGEVLKRFNIILDYPNNRITLRKNNNFHSPFHYNMSGIELQHDGMRYVSESIASPTGIVKADQKKFGDVQILLEDRFQLSLVPEIVVSGIRAGSPAEMAGLQEGDVILAVNGKPVHRYKLQEVVQMLNEKEGKRIRVRIARQDKDLLYSFVLKDLFKQKP